MCIAIHPRTLFKQQNMLDRYLATVAHGCFYLVKKDLACVWSRLFDQIKLVVIQINA